MSDLQQSRMWIDGQWVRASSGDEIESIDPSTEKPFALFPAVAAEDVNAAVQATRKAPRVS